MNAKEIHPDAAVGMEANGNGLIETGANYLKIGYVIYVGVSTAAENVSSKLQQYDSCGLQPLSEERSLWVRS